MRYLVRMRDGTVIISTLLPKAVSIDGVPAPVVGTRKGNGRRFLLCAGIKGEKIEVDIPAAVEDLEENSLPAPYGSIEFYDIEKDCLDKWVTPAKADVLDWRRITAAEIPADRTYRAAWRHDGAKIVEDPAEKRKILAQMALFRERQAEREAELNAKIQELENR